MPINIFDYPFVHIVSKFAFITIAIMFLIYSFIVFRQVSVMKRTLETNYSPLITLLGFSNLALGATLLIIYMIIL